MHVHTHTHTFFPNTIHFTLKMEAATLSKMWASYHNITQCHSPEHLNLNLHHHVNLKTNIFINPTSFLWIPNSVRVLYYISLIESLSLKTDDHKITYKVYSEAT